jgi:hypothetical protein
VRERKTKGKLTAGNITQNCQQDVDQKVSTASALKEDTKRREEDSKNDLADIAIEKVSFTLKVGDLMRVESLGGKAPMRSVEAFLPGGERHDDV